MLDSLTLEKLREFLIQSGLCEQSERTGQLLTDYGDAEDSLLQLFALLQKDSE